MRLQALYFIGALAVSAIPLSAGAQSLPAYHQRTTNAQADNQPVQRCPPGYDWGACRISPGRLLVPCPLRVAQSHPDRCAGRVLAVDGQTIDF